MTDIADQLILELQKNIQKHGRAVLVIDGDCAAGKTTLAARIAARLSCSVFHMDDFFLPPALRTETRLNEAGGNIHYERFEEQMLRPLQKNESFSYGAYSCADHSTREVTVTPKPAAVIEGSYALHPRFLPVYQAMSAVLVFLRIPAEEQLRRIQSRNGEAMLRRFKEEWIPMEKQYQQAYQNRWADVEFIDGC